MKISEMIKKLEELKEQVGDVRITIYDDYTAYEGYDYDDKDLWLDVTADPDIVIDDEGCMIETVILIH